MSDEMVMDVVDAVRGCGTRKPGGYYLVHEEGSLRSCGRMPIPLTVCPCCRSGIKPARGFAWLDGDTIKDSLPVCKDDLSGGGCCTCPLQDHGSIGQVGVIWVGERFYATPEDFMQEAFDQGISRRVTAVPKDFKVGETWVWLCHRKTVECPTCDGQGMNTCLACTDAAGERLENAEGLCDVCGCEAGGEAVECDTCGGHGKRPGVFHVFMPKRIEYITKGDETDEELKRLHKRNIQPVRVTNLAELEAELNGEDEDEAETLFDEADDPGDMDGDHETGLASAGFGTDEDYGGGCDQL